MLRRILQHAFCFTFVWIGMLIAISFVEAPLKFQAPSVTLAIGLEIGYLVFHALNVAELLFAIVLMMSMRSHIASRQTTRVGLFVITMLLMQTVLLYTVLDTRTLAIINGQSVPDAPYHLIYIGLECIKLIALFKLGQSQIQDYTAQLRLGAQHG